MLPAVRAVPGRLGRRGGLDVVRVSAGAICGAVVAALVGDFASYWGVSLTGRLGQLLWGGGFVLEMLALLVLMVGMAVYGVAAARTGRVSRTVGALLSGAVLAVIPTVVFVTNYVPNGIVLPLSLAWAICAVIMLAPGQSSSGVSKRKHRVVGEANGTTADGAFVPSVGQRAPGTSTPDRTACGAPGRHVAAPWSQRRAVGSRGSRVHRRWTSNVGPFMCPGAPRARWRWGSAEHG
jgi:hypothetical protein